MPYYALDPANADPAAVTTAGQPLQSVGETLASFLDELDDITGERDDLIAAQNTKFVNRAYGKVCGMVNLKELFGSVAYQLRSTQPMYLLPEQVSWIKRIALVDEDDFVDGGTELAMIDEDAFRGLPEADDDIPSQFVRVARMFALWPAPTDSWDLTVDFKVRPDDLTTDIDSPILPIEWHEGILLYARARLFRAVRNYKEAAQATNDALAVLRPLLNTDSEELSNAEFALAPVKKRSQMRGTKG